MYIDFKETIWVRAFIPEENKETILKELRNGNIKNCDNVFNFVEDVETEYLYDTGVQIEPNGEHTIEGFEDDGETIFTN